MCITFAPPNFNMKDDIDFSYYVVEEDSSIIIPYPTLQEHTFGAIVTAFKTEVYYELCILRTNPTLPT